MLQLLADFFGGRADGHCPGKRGLCPRFGAVPSGGVRPPGFGGVRGAGHRHHHLIQRVVLGGGHPAKTLRAAPVCKKHRIFALYLHTLFWKLCRTRQKGAGLLAQYQGELSRAAFNSAAFGALLVAASERYSLGGWIGFGLGSGIGYTGALLLLYIAQEQFQMMDIPKVFRGLPILLVYIGIISLSIYGLIGHQLPA